MLNAQNAGARAVVIANNVAGGAFSDGGTDRKVKIPSAMVTQANGVTLKGQAGSNAVLKANANALQVDGDLDSDIVDYGQTADKLMADFVDGMNFTPASPTPEKMRDGMLSSRELCPRADVVRGLSTRSGQSRPLP